MKKPELITLDEFKKLTLSEKAKYLNETAPAKFKPHILPTTYFYILLFCIGTIGGFFDIFGLTITFTVLYIIMDIFYNKWYCDKYHLEYSKQISLFFRNLQ
jgi:hypothetical protein